MVPLRAAAAALLVPIAAFAADPETFRCEARGGSAWREYRTAHFLVATDLSAPRAEATVRDLEQLHALVVQALVGDGVDIPGKVRVVAFSDPRDYQRIRPGDVDAYFTVGPLLTPTVVFASDGFQADPELIAHELAHHVSWYLFPRQPTWFAEGLAWFVQSVGRTRNDAAPAVGTHIVRGARNTGRWAGMVKPEMARWFQDWGGDVPPDLLTWSGMHDGDQHFRYEAWSWLLYHWMWNTRPKAFTEFTTRLSNAADPGDAWRACFPDLDPSTPQGKEALANELGRHKRTGRFASYEVKASFDARFTAKPIPPAEVHMILLTARGRPADKAAIRAEVDEALREDGLHPIAAWAGSDGPEQLRGMLAKSTAARPDDWRAWYLLSTTLGGRDERAEKEAALRKALALNAESASVRNELAWLLAGSGRAKEALSHANAAADLAPWSPAVIDTLAAVALELGKCPEALVLQRRALELLHPGTGDRPRYERRLAEVGDRCAAGAAAATPASGTR